MTIESDVHAAIATVCPRVHAVLAPLRTQRPYVTVQNIGGDPTYYLNRSAADKRVLRLLVKTWANSKAESLDLIRQVEQSGLHGSQLRQQSGVAAQYPVGIDRGYSKG